MISREELSSWLDNLAGEATLMAPRDVEGVLLYRQVDNSQAVVWDYVHPVMSIKDAFFPPTERLLTIEKTGQTIKLEETHYRGKQVIFGVRPCDARGMLALDALFVESEPVDPYYAERRENTTIVGLACSEMADTCFCTSTGGAPDDPTGMDILIKEVDGGYAVQVLTEKGRLIASPDWDASAEPLSRGDYPAQYTIPPKGAWPAQFNDSYWAEMSERCLSCRICAYVCPTCRCFDVRDETLSTGNGKNKFERIRCWDSCAGTVYRRIAGGQNPRDEKGKRLRNRFMCKFYYYPEQYGPEACTGCGRCIDSCPVNIDITEVLQHVMEVTP
jgi:ferredoxin